MTDKFREQQIRIDVVRAAVAAFVEENTASITHEGIGISVDADVVRELLRRTVPADTEVPTGVHVRMLTDHGPAGVRPKLCACEESISGSRSTIQYAFGTAWRWSPIQKCWTEAKQTPGAVIP